MLTFGLKRKTFVSEKEKGWNGPDNSGFGNNGWLCMDVQLASSGVLHTFH